MIPIALAGRLLAKWSFTDIPVVKSLISASFGVLVSWALAFVFVLLRRKYGKHVPELDVQITVRNSRDIEATDSED